MRKEIGLVIVIALIFAAGCAEEQVIGGDKDEHGCLIAAGYSWCESKQECIRAWEEGCPSEEEFACEEDSDCIPLPSDCHPMLCINKAYEPNYEKPEVCTEIFMYEAAYNPEDCLCVDKVCVNKNLGRNAEDESISLEEAVAIAEDSECTEKGVLTENSFYNENTRTWWIDLEMKDEFELESCNPACVISEETKTAEINWRCTGLVNDKEQDCIDSGGEWKTFSDACVDSCEYRRNDDILCGMVITESCDCGEGMCWNGESCEPI